MKLATKIFLALVIVSLCVGAYGILGTLTGSEYGVTMFNRVAISDTSTQGTYGNELATVNFVNSTTTNSVPAPATGNTSTFLWSNGSATSWQKGVSVLTASLTSAQLKNLNATPVNLVISPGAGKFYMIDKVIFKYSRGTASYTNVGGGDVSLKQGAVNILTASEITPLITAGASAITQKNALDGLVLTENPITISKATSEFAAGDGTLTIYIWYTAMP